MKTNQNDQKETQAKIDVLGAQKFTFAIMIFIVYLIFIGYLIFKTETKDDLIWTRLLYLFTGIEAIVFAAIGYVFGKDINRVRAENAERDAIKSKEEEEKAKLKAEKAKKEAQNDRENLIRLQEAVISEYDQAHSFNKNIRDNFQTFGTSKDKNEQKRAVTLFHLSKSRSINLAKSKVNVQDVTYVELEYKVEASGFKGVIIDGQPQDTSTGFLAEVVSTSSGIEVTMDWDRSGEWKFTAFNIRNLDTGEKMKMVPDPLKSNSRTSYFNVV